MCICYHREPQEGCILYLDTQDHLMTKGSDEATKFAILVAKEQLAICT